MQAYFGPRINAFWRRQQLIGLKTHKPQRTETASLHVIVRTKGSRYPPVHLYQDLHSPLIESLEIVESSGLFYLNSLNRSISDSRVPS